MGRSLFLHLSALSNDEYDAYIGALHDLLDEQDDRGNAEKDISGNDLERQHAPLAVVRAWIKGRFRDIRPDVIEQVRTPVDEVNLWATENRRHYTGLGTLHSAASRQANVWWSDPGSFAVAQSCSIRNARYRRECVHPRYVYFI
jgi:hypothetical protein